MQQLSVILSKKPTHKNQLTRSYHRSKSTIKMLVTTPRFEPRPTGDRAVAYIVLIVTGRTSMVVVKWWLDLLWHTYATLNDLILEINTFATCSIQLSVFYMYTTIYMFIIISYEVRGLTQRYDTLLLTTFQPNLQGEEATGAV